MQLECTREEAEILIAALTFAEGAAATIPEPGITEALKVLAPWRTTLIRTYLQSFFVMTPGCDCGEDGNSDPEYHASDCNWRVGVQPISD
jgi:hypothetical protein